jgi:hypothetical protein
VLPKWAASWAETGPGGPGGNDILDISHIGAMR